MEAQGSGVRSLGSSSTLDVGRRAGELVLSTAGRASAAGPTLQPREVEPIFRRPAAEPARLGQPEAQATLLGPRPAPAAERPAEPAPPRAPAAPPFEWIDLELVPPGAPPNPRGYSVYSKTPQPLPAPVILIDTAA